MVEIWRGRSTWDVFNCWTYFLLVIFDPLLPWDENHHEIFFGMFFFSVHLSKKDLQIQECLYSPLPSLKNETHTHTHTQTYT